MKQTLLEINSKFIKRSQKMIFENIELPVKVTDEREALAINPMHKWTILEDPKRLVRQYDFRLRDQKRDFITGLLDYEDETSHQSKMTLFDDSVQVEVWTKGIDQPSELDKEYAKFADSLYRDIVYSTGHEEEATGRGSGNVISDADEAEGASL